MLFFGEGNREPEVKTFPPPPDAFDATAESGPVRNIILNLGKDHTSRNITWSSTEECDMYVEWVKTDIVKNADFSVDVHRSKAERSSRDQFNYTFRAKIDALEEHTSYAYRVGGDECGWSDAYLLKTADFSDGVFSFVFVGDPQIGASGENNIDSERWNGTLEKVREWFGDRIEFLLCAGDQIDDSFRDEQFNGYCSPGLLRSLPQLNNVGNHDSGASYSDHFTFDDADQATAGSSGAYGGDYWTAYDGILIISLNTNTLDTALHIDFAKKAIEDYKTKYGEPYWKIVTLHHSFYSANADRFNNGGDSRSDLSPAFSEMGIDAVLMGHDHIYTRSLLEYNDLPIDDPDLYAEVADDMFGSVVDPAEGLVFYLTVNSSSGSKYYNMYNEYLPYVACKNQENVPNFTKIDVTPDSITFRTYRSMVNNEIGDVVDFFAIRKTGRSETDAVAPHLDVPSDSVFRSDELFDPLEGIFAYDNADGDLTGSIVVSGKPDPCKKSVLKYSVTDSSGNTAVAYRTLRPQIGTNTVDKNTKWKYLDSGDAPFCDAEDFSEWTLSGFDDSGWKTGSGSFGSVGGEHGSHCGKTDDTLINYVFPEGSEEEGNVIPNYFFRTTFDLDDPSSVDSISGRLFYDDGFDVYINGVCVRSVNTQTASDKIGYCSNNSGGDASGDGFTINDKSFISSLRLRKKGNVLAVELFQSSGYSDDIFFEFDFLNMTHNLRGMPFTDVEENKWYYTNIGKAYCRGLFAGVSKTTFAPGEPFTRAMSWTVLAKMAGAKQARGDKWYSGPQTWAVENGISDGTMPNKKVTREQLSLMLYNYAGKPEVDGDISSFTDSDKAAKWAKRSLAWAVENGLISGRGNGILAPKANATRAEACTIIINFIERIKK